MKTGFVTPQKYAEAALRIVDRTEATGIIRPERFIQVMRENRGLINAFNSYGPSGDGLERKNPVIVALGDSVTAGHFEFTGDPEEFFARADRGELKENEAIEITDARECYLEKFRYMLIDKYEQTSVSVINAGIAGDTMYGMKNRVYRDVIRYQPDLVIINGSLNWNEECGNTEAYKRVLTEVVKLIKKETKADIIMMTPNMAIQMEFTSNSQSSLDERVEVIRELEKTEGVCLADTYKIWKTYEAEGYPIEVLLANGFNHPSVTGHEIFARVLMQLMD